MLDSALLIPINAFLKCQTPQAWLDEAIKPANFPMLLLDHLVCELNDIVSKYKLS
ncbi:tRNA isopentenyl-2-thiomethyl-A-37 hydroxylase MiaE [Colwellia chukchiensis]|uniref:tRNA isopentenyl-2-thiomethyl-A-37 hydroxylase MiaE n=1 Tax=Colwellia chukchiensis TaxID=641665 RepID=UPI000A178363